MQIHQIVIRPGDNTTVILYIDAAGNRNSMVIDIANDPHATALIAAAQQRLPADTENPNKPEIQKEIADLENRVMLLKQAIGVA